MKKVALVVPAFNEENNIDSVLCQVKKYIDLVVVVDDGSVDNTHDIAGIHSSHCLRHEINLGKGAAMKTGCEYAFFNLDAGAVVFIDADNQHNADEIISFIEKLNEGYDAVYGVREFTSEMPFHKRISNKIATTIFYLLYGAWIPDIPSGYKAITKSAYKKIKWGASGYSVELEIAARAASVKVKHCTIPVSTQYHDHEKGMTNLNAFLIALEMIRLRLTI